MLKPARFKKFSVVLLQEDLQRVLDELHEDELLEIRKVDLEEKELEAFEISEREKFASFHLTKTKRILNFFKAHNQSKSIKTMLCDFLFERKPKREKEPKDFSGLERKVLSFLLPLSEKVEGIDRKLKSLNERIALLSEEKSVLETIKGLGIEMDLLHGFQRIEVVIGRIPVELEPALRERITKTKNARLIRVIGEKEKIVLFSVETEKAEAVLRELRKIGFDRIAVPEYTGKIENLIPKIESSLARLKQQQKNELKKARELARKNKARLLALQELLEIEKSKSHALSFFGKTEKTASFEAFVPLDKVSKFRQILAKKTNERFYAEEVPFTEKEAPIKLKNPPFVRDYEYLLKMYGLPEYNAIDPTLFIALLFPVFFGLAFSDLGYGLILIALGLFLRFTLGKKEEGWAHLTNILWHGGIFTAIFGFIFGSFFGDLGNFAKKFAIVNTLSANGAKLFLAVIVFVGVMHLNLGIIMGIREALRKKEYKKALTEKFSWIILQVGVILISTAMVLHTNTESVFFYWGVFLVGLTLLLLFWNGGPLGLMKVTGYLGNVLSYLRLVALGLATFAIAMSINKLAMLVAGIPFVGWIIAILFLVFGHFANFLFNLLSSFIHPFRLHCVEFFSYFYEGTGNEFSPFHIKRKLTEKREVK